MPLKHGYVDASPELSEISAREELNLRKLAFVGILCCSTKVLEKAELLVTKGRKLEWLIIHWQLHDYVGCDKWKKRTFSVTQLAE